MPNYDYVCEKCNEKFEFFQRMSDDALEVCPKEKCPKARWGKGKVKRAIGAGAGLIFKGSGFYITDYRSDSYKESAKKDKPSSDSPKKDSGSKSSESKPTKAKTKSSE